MPRVEVFCCCSRWICLGITRKPERYIHFESKHIFIELGNPFHGIIAMLEVNQFSRVPSYINCRSVFMRTGLFVSRSCEANDTKVQSLRPLNVPFVCFFDHPLHDSG